MFLIGITFFTFKHRFRIANVIGNSVWTDGGWCSLINYIKTNAEVNSEELLVNYLSLNPPCMSLDLNFSCNLYASSGFSAPDMTSSTYIHLLDFLTKTGSDSLYLLRYDL